MISLLIVLFFGATGITLNHPSWTLGDHADTSTATGTLPSGFTSNGTVDFLKISEFVRGKYGITAPVSDYAADQSQGHISYAAPGYAASAVFDVTAGTYTVHIEQQGFVAVLNDLHKGRSTNGAWNWTIDVAGGFLVAVALTGLGIQLFLRQRRGRLLGVAIGGAVLVLILGYATLG